MEPFSDLIKQREICFLASPKHDTPAHHAAQLLDGVEGVLSAHAPRDTFLVIEYRVDLITLRMLESALTEVGFELVDNLLCRARRAVQYFTEETQLANMGYTAPDSKSTTQLFINSYLQREHGCRDERPMYYHHYN